MGLPDNHNPDFFSGYGSPALEAGTEGEVFLSIPRLGIIYKVISSGEIEHFAGDRQYDPHRATSMGMAVDTSGNLFVTTGSRINKIQNGTTTTVAGGYVVDSPEERLAPRFSQGDGGPALKASVHASDLTLDAQGNLFFASPNPISVRKIARVADAGLVGGLPFPLSPGDVNRDGMTDVLDAILCLRVIVGLFEFSELQQKEADVDENGKLTVTDVVLILKFVVGVPTLK